MAGKTDLKNKIPRIEKTRHSLAHILAMAVLQKFPSAKLGVGPVIENGFYYDFLLPRRLKNEELAEIESAMKKIAGEKLEFRGKKISLAEGKKMFKNQPFKLELLKEFAREKKTLTVYAAGWFTDLCRGGHVKNTAEINASAFKLTKTAGAYWRGNEKNPMLARIYGVAFSSEAELEKHLKLLEEIEKRDHRLLGEKLDLFSQHAVAPGAVFWHHKGMLLWRTLENFMRQKLDGAGYEEISTPVMVKKEVFVKSGHFRHFRENMFAFEIDGETYVLKPMNCPESAYVYASRLRSWRDLPLKFSEITGRLHRHERSGTLGGLFRVRQMTQDDAHIYCAPEQIESEINSLLLLIQEIYGKFGLPVSYKLALKPDKAMGSPALWKKAESALRAILKKSGRPYEIKPKDGAFYGPKIDMHIKDALGRDWQLATIQLDFQLAENFDLSYIERDGRKKRPVVVHRAIFGTFERFIGVLIEHYAGAFPFWLAPLQIAVLNVAEASAAYARSVCENLRKNGFRVFLDGRNETIGKKIREAEMQKIPYLLVIGEREAAAQTVAVRERGAGDKGQMALNEFLRKISIY